MSESSERARIGRNECGLRRAAVAQQNDYGSNFIALAIISVVAASLLLQNARIETFANLTLKSSGTFFDTFCLN